jgi:hypothetical protein
MLTDVSKSREILLLPWNLRGHYHIDNSALAFVIFQIV